MFCAVLASEPEVAVAGRAAAELDGAPGAASRSSGLCLRWTTSSQKCSWPALSLSRVDVPARAEMGGARPPCSQYADNVAAFCAASPRRRAPWRGGGNGSPASSTFASGDLAWPSTRSRRPWPSEELWLQASHQTWRWLSQPVSRYGRTDAGACGLAALQLPLRAPLSPAAARETLASAPVRGLRSLLAARWRVFWPRSRHGRASRSRRSYAALFLAVVAPLPGLVADYLGAASVVVCVLHRPGWRKYSSCLRGAVPEDRAISTASREALALESNVWSAIYELAG